MRPSLFVALSFAVACAPARGGSDVAPTTLESAPLDADLGGDGSGGAVGDGVEAKPEVEPERPAEPESTDSELVLGAQIGATVAEGLAQFAAELDATVEGQGTLWVGPLEGNGGRDVLIYIPPGADPAAPFELVVHFHGTYSEVVAKRRATMKKKREWVGWDRLTQTVEAVTELQTKRASNAALVYPISAGKRLEPGHRGWSNVAYDQMWMDPVQPPDYRDDFAKLYTEVAALLEARLGVDPSKIPERVIAEGHSAGGIALLNVAVNGSDHVGEYIFLDASFQGWADGCYEAIKASGSPARMTIVQTDKGMADPFEGRTPWCTDTELDAALWAKHARWCASRPDETVPESDWTCAELEVIAEDWDASQREWCAAMAEGMKTIPEVTLVETSVYHKDMPRRFSGGLDLERD